MILFLLICQFRSCNIYPCLWQWINRTYGTYLSNSPSHLVHGLIIVFCMQNSFKRKKLNWVCADKPYVPCNNMPFAENTVRQVMELDAEKLYLVCDSIHKIIKSITHINKVCNNLYTDLLKCENCFLLRFCCYILYHNQ